MTNGSGRCWSGAASYGLLSKPAAIRTNVEPTAVGIFFEEASGGLHFTDLTHNRSHNKGLLVSARRVAEIVVYPRCHQVAELHISHVRMEPRSP